jgi:hypothetical protein
MDMLSMRTDTSQKIDEIYMQFLLFPYVDFVFFILYDRYITIFVKMNLPNTIAGYFHIYCNFKYTSYYLYLNILRI